GARVRYESRLHLSRDLPEDLRADGKGGLDVQLPLRLLRGVYDLHRTDQPGAGELGGLDRPQPPLLRRRAPQEQDVVLLLLVERVLAEVDPVVDHAGVAEALVE